MTTPTQQEIINVLTELCELSPDVRTGQLMDHLRFLSEDRFDRSFSDLEDHQLLEVMLQHRAELARRREHVA